MARFPAVVVEPALMVLPPWVSYVTASVFAVHCAKRIVSLVNPYASWSVYEVPPVPEEVVCQPANV